MQGGHLKNSKHFVLLSSNSGGGTVTSALFYHPAREPTRWCSDEVQSVYRRERGFATLEDACLGETQFYWFLPGWLIRFATFINRQRIPRTVTISLFNWLLITFLRLAKAEPPFSLPLCKPIAVTLPAPKAFLV